jgi:hypothetical protein
MNHQQQPDRERMMSDKHEQTQISDKLTDPVVNPAIAALEKTDFSTVIIKGFLGTSENSVVRLYRGFDTSAYVEIPRKGVVHMEPDKDGETGSYRVFVRASCEILSVLQRRLPAGEWPGRPQPGWPFPEGYLPEGLILEEEWKWRLPELLPIEVDPYACAKSAVEEFKRRILLLSRTTTSGSQARQNGFDTAVDNFNDALDACRAAASGRKWWPPLGVEILGRRIQTPPGVIRFAAAFLGVTP